MVGLLALAPAFAAGADPGSLALSVFGLVLAFRSLQKVGGALATFSSAALSFRQIKPLFDAAEVTEPLAPEQAEATTRGETVLEARDLVYRHQGRAEPAVRGASLRLREGDRVLLRGATGSGKSTFGALLCGLRAPDSGLLWLRRLDRRTLGAEGWRRRVACAPQFHENHVLTGTFAFNLLMGRGWPPTPDEAKEAEQICRELDLGPLLQRMPAGILQSIGETGWQLSHGEKSRLFIARALLQRSEIVLLDESFAALDPMTMGRALKCVLGRARTLVVIAHP